MRVKVNDLANLGTHVSQGIEYLVYYCEDITVKTKFY